MCFQLPPVSTASFESFLRNRDTGDQGLHGTDGLSRFSQWPIGGVTVTVLTVTVTVRLTPFVCERPVAL